MERKLLLFDLDGTLLTSQKTISPRTLKALQACRKRGWLVGISTSRGKANCLTFIADLQPEILISSGGAVVKYGSEYICLAEFTPEETRGMVRTAKEICGPECKMTIDTLAGHYWSRNMDLAVEPGWGESVFADLDDFSESSLKFCTEIFDPAQAEKLAAALPDCDCIRFSDGFWYKFTKKEATKENAIRMLAEKCGIAPENIIAFGDDWADLGMLKICGTGVAMGNAIEEVRAAADVVIGGNDEEGIAEYLEKTCL